MEFRKIAGIVVAVACLAAASSASAERKKERPANGEFSPSRFTCLAYTNGLGPNSSTRAQTNIAQLWMLGYLAGYYKASGKLEVTEDKEEEKILADLFEHQCRQSPENSIFAAVSLGIAPAVYKLPKTLMIGFSPTEYTCAEHVGRGGAAGDANKADVAELWAFAFIQGYKNVAQPGMEIGAEFKPAVIGAINRSCGSNGPTKYMDLAAMVAEKVKMQ